MRGRGKAGFANRTRNFAKHARDLRLIPAMPVIGLVLGGLATVTGAFGTGRMPLWESALFWLLLMQWSALKWTLWFTWRVRSPRDWWRAALIGAVPLNLLVPVEVGFTYWLLGYGVIGGYLSILTSAFALAALLLVLLLWLFPPQWNRRQVAGPIGQRGFDIAKLDAIVAEDHYCRLYLREGRQELIAARFGDALAEVAAIPGERINRGIWVSDTLADRVGRKGRVWEVTLPCGTALRVSQRYRATLVARGWIQPGT